MKVIQLPRNERITTMYCTTTITMSVLVYKSLTFGKPKTNFCEFLIIYYSLGNSS